MGVLFAGGDIGGVRCLVPVAEACLTAGIDVMLAAHGALPAEWRGDPARLLSVMPPDLPPATECLIFSTSLTDGFALTLARAAAQAGIPTIHLLDHWTAYRARMVTDGGPPFRPTIYAVLDDLARSEAAAAGIDETSLLIVGQPALHDLPTRRDRPPPNGLPQVMFVGEPVTRDQGSDFSNPAFRGYTELDAIDWIARALIESEVPVDLRLLPHPRQSREEMMAAWLKAGRGVPARLADTIRGRDQFAELRGLIGMASMLLYEGWLYGLPVLSVQPNRCGSLLQTLAGRQSAWLVEREEQMKPALSAWLDGLSHDLSQFTEAAQELARHHAAPRTVLAVIQSCLQTGFIQ